MIENEQASTVSDQKRSRLDPPLFWGQRLPNFTERTRDGGRFEYHRDVTRGPAVLVANPSRDELKTILDSATAASPEVNVIVIGEVETPADGPAPKALLPDPDGRLRRALFTGRDDVKAVLVADPDQRGIAAFEIDDYLAIRLDVALAPLRREAPQMRRSTAPVLILPNLIDTALRDDLLDAFHRHNEEGKVSVTIDGENVGRVAPHIKRRRDLTLDRKDPLYAAVTQAIGKRLMPEVYKAWWVTHLRTEAFYVASYTAERGDFFVAHRDNTLPHTASRRIAVSIELNDDYTGGGLVFPEYSDDRWRAPMGGGLAFSCSLMHEAMAVESGTRYVLLVFLAAPGQ
ncbi:2OG-Fe(II) oxygenase [Thalassobaculum sp. OXR-137]|uniref:2OG-Fe(II) oxygenase n=1 Tax=Thalassobaculum sp. OXR-137 TaxID=3100173 RepID=UPI002AC8F12B|nr:2OG-Fe(II) oxygenase [Thalassobaculum sp. OXR-137]WPZ34698.1 2OG-Fe(II) oxygenase [Thalassobaculum sp. OXR-137]